MISGDNALKQIVEPISYSILKKPQQSKMITIVQEFYDENRPNRKLIATEGNSTDLSSSIIPLKHTKSPTTGTCRKTWFI